MSEGNITIPLSKFVVQYMKAGRGTFDYIEEMIECALNLLGEDADFPEQYPFYEFVEWGEETLVLRDRTMGSLFNKKAPVPDKRHELYSLLSLLKPLTLVRFVRYLEEDLLERAFNGPN